MTPVLESTQPRPSRSRTQSTHPCYSASSTFFNAIIVRPPQAPDLFKAGYSWMPRTPPSSSRPTPRARSPGLAAGVAAGSRSPSPASYPTPPAEGVSMAQTQCAEISRGARHGGVWRNSRSIDLEMLTPIDQPLDKLKDLTPEEDFSIIPR
ncbi:hypothetical protein BJY52DRAFT_580276 [Lactarius psammicola]|nr:hypothetical protein BJY52DRAFT_580276 [Lactarius psammicola]